MGNVPQTVNAYYNLLITRLFPAAIYSRLQPKQMKLNYGGIGGVMTISHGFDDSGSRYNGNQ
jgi:predicted metalloendopeptidase